MEGNEKNRRKLTGFAVVYTFSLPPLLKDFNKFTTTKSPAQAAHEHQMGSPNQATKKQKV
jgi:hypothetical protein